MRIAFDPSSTRGQKTGIGVYTDNLRRALREVAPQIEQVELPDGARADQRTDRRIWREQFAIPALAGRVHPDLLHLTGFAAPMRAPCRVVLSAHDLIGILFPNNFPRPSRFYWSRYLPFTLRFADQLVVPSEQTRGDIRLLLGIAAERITVIPPGKSEYFRPIKDAAMLEAARAKYDLPPRFLLFVSTLEPRKGVDTCIQAYARAARDIPEALVIVGKRGWYWDTFFEQVRAAGIENCVRFVDYLPPEELPQLYNLATALVFPSRYEGFGLTPLEAMACGTPVIGSNASSLPEVVGDAGMLLRPDDVEGFARAIVTISREESLRHELRGRGLTQAGKFSWQRTARETVAVYEKVLNARHV